MSAGNLSGKDPPDKDNPDQEAMNVSITLSEHDETPAEEAPVVPALTYASAVTSNEETDEIVDVLRIVLKKTKPGANYHLKDWERGRLVFMKLGIPRDKVVGIDLEDFRTIRVHMNSAAAPWKIAHSIEVKDGLITLPMRMFRRYTKVVVKNAGVDTDPATITQMLSHFGHFGDLVQIKERMYFENADLSKLSLEEKMMRGLKTGDFEVQMFITKSIPSFAMLVTGKRVRVQYPSQPATCGRCMQGIRGCKGGANAAKCEKNGGEKLDFNNWWDILIAPSETEARQPGGQPEMCEGGEEAAIPNTVLRIEGLGKKAGPEWVKLYLSTCVNRTLEDVELKQSENKLAWEVSGLSPEEVQKTLQTVSGTQFKGKTVYCVPVVTDIQSANNSSSPSSESGSGGETEKGTEEASIEEIPKTPEKAQAEDDEDGDFEKVERRRKSAEKAEKAERKKLAKEKAATEAKAEAEVQKDLLKSPGKSPGKQVNTRKRDRGKVSPDKAEAAAATGRSKRGKGAAKADDSSQSK